MTNSTNGTRLKNLDINGLPSGIQIERIPQQQALTQVVDPWYIFSYGVFDSFMALLAIAEVTLFPESKHNLLRETMLNMPGVGPTTSRSVVETQYITSFSDSKTKVSDQLRARDRLIILFAPLIWIPSIVYATSNVWRPRFVQSMVINGDVPVFTSEVFKRTRSSTVGSLRITPGLALATYTSMVDKMPTLKDTYWDPNFLLSENGLVSYTSFLTRLKGEPANYIPYVKADSTTLPPMESNYFITFGSMTTQAKDHITSSKISVIETSSSVVSASMVTDAAILRPVYKDDKDVLFTSHLPMADTFGISCSLMSLAYHIVQRTTGIVSNPSKNDSDHSKNTKQSNVKTEYSNDSTWSSNPKENPLDEKPYRKSNDFRGRIKNKTNRDILKSNINSFVKLDFNDVEAIVKIVLHTISQYKQRNLSNSYSYS